VTRTEDISVGVMRVLPALVGFFPVGRACDSYGDYICDSNDSYRKYIFKNNDSYRKCICTNKKDAASASWRFSGRVIRTEDLFVRVMIRTESISVRVMTRTETLFVRAIRMLPQLVIRTDVYL
jgi:hypothetical protein